MKTVCIPMLSLLLLSGCGSGDETPQTGEPADSTWQADLSLQSLLPSEAGYTWHYFGFAEYVFSMQLEQVYTDDASIVYAVSGMVEDMSDGESDLDFGIDLDYVVSDSTLSMVQTSEVSMDNDFAEMVLVRLPLTAGNTWNQTVTNLDGEYVELVCEIEEVEQGPPMRVTVRYRDTASPFYQFRVFEEGVGVVTFEKLFMSPDGDFEIGYSIFRE
ncbi:MAG: hypothetical protein R6V62_04685 [Candidatus Fermentibacteraceae bacterium]